MKLTIKLSELLEGKILKWEYKDYMMSFPVQYPGPAIVVEIRKKDGKVFKELKRKFRTTKDAKDFMKAYIDDGSVKELF